MSKTVAALSVAALLVVISVPPPSPVETPGSSSHAASPGNGRSTLQLDDPDDVVEAKPAVSARWRSVGLRGLLGTPQLVRQREDQAFLGGLDRLDVAVTALGQPVEHLAHEDLRHRGTAGD